VRLLRAISGLPFRASLLQRGFDLAAKLGRRAALGQFAGRQLVRELMQLVDEPPRDLPRTHAWPPFCDAIRAVR
jgi:hypothetical protein